MIITQVIRDFFPTTGSDKTSVGICSVCCNITMLGLLLLLYSYNHLLLHFIADGALCNYQLPPAPQVSNVYITWNTSGGCQRAKGWLKAWAFLAGGGGYKWWLTGLKDSKQCCDITKLDVLIVLVNFKKDIKQCYYVNDVINTFLDTNFKISWDLRHPSADCIQRGYRLSKCSNNVFPTFICLSASCRGGSTGTEKKSSQMVE